MEKVEVGKGLIAWQIGMIILVGLLVLLSIKIYRNYKKKREN
ncbi:hypothetical protein [Chryseobacterium soli]|nr:hypothetical protein [Chryseobacterium soli]